MMKEDKNEWVLQCVIFNGEYFETKKQVKDWIERKGFKLLKNKNPIKKFDNCYRVRQKEPKLFKPFKPDHKIKMFSKNKVKGIYGKLK